jgi:hypothetical protein
VVVDPVPGARCAGGADRGNEEAFLRWFYDGAAGNPAVFDHDLVAEYLRTFSGASDASGSMGVFRAAFASIAQTEPSQDAKITISVVGIDGKRGLGKQVGSMLHTVAENVTAVTPDDFGHFVPEEAPRETR